eukprot:1002443_1
MGQCSSTPAEETTLTSGVFNNRMDRNSTPTKVTKYSDTYLPIYSARFTRPRESFYSHFFTREFQSIQVHTTDDISLGLVKDLDLNHPIMKNDTTYKERVDILLSVVESQRKEIYCAVNTFSNNNGINGFIADCGEYVMNIDSIYADNMNKCALERCECIKREFLNINIYDKNCT